MKMTTVDLNQTARSIDDAYINYRVFLEEQPPLPDGSRSFLLHAQSYTMLRRYQATFNVPAHTQSAYVVDLLAAISRQALHDIARRIHADDNSRLAIPSLRSKLNTLL